MYSPEVHYLVRKEMYKDERRNVARHQLIHLAKLSNPDNRESLRRMVGWIGAHMVKWGLKLRPDNQHQHQTIIQQG